MQMSMVMHWEVNSRMNSGMYRMNCRMDGMDCWMNTQCWMTVIFENWLKIWSEWWRVRFMVNIMMKIMVNIMVTFMVKIMMNFIMNWINRMFFMMDIWLFTWISISTVKFGNVWLGCFLLWLMMVRFWSVVRFGTRMDNFIRLQRLWLRSLIVMIMGVMMIVRLGT